MRRSTRLRHDWTLLLALVGLCGAAAVLLLVGPAR